MTKEYKGYELHENNGILYPFKARPYDDADYYYAISRDGGKHWVIAFRGKQCVFVTGDWKKAVNWLETLNAKIKPKMLYD